MENYNILIRNFLRIIRSGAFFENRPIRIMSAYKWSEMVNLAYAHDLTTILAKGMEQYVHDDQLNIPKDQIEVIRQQLQNSSPMMAFSSLYNFDHLHFHNKQLNADLKQIRDDEYADNEKSYETMQLMAIIVTNVEHMLNGESYLKGIIDLGRYLRSEGNKVDFVKLENWLAKTKMTKMASYQGAILIEGFGFNLEEFPFITSKVKNAKKALMRSLDSAPSIAYNHDNSNKRDLANDTYPSMKRNLSCLKYYRLARQEVIATVFQGFKRRLTEIEE